MKDRLRELVELDEAACVPVNRPNLYAPGWNDCRAVVLAILDAEGDGGAAPCEAMKLLIAIREDDYLSDSSRHRIDTLRNTNPARSGVVSNKDVDEAMLAYNVDCHSRGDLSNARGTAMRAALESYERSRK